MSGIDDQPLLMLDRIGEGRVALMASDQTWLWDRGFEGGGPQLELLRRLAHWMMKEPDLEEETLWVEPNGLNMRIIRRTLEDSAGPVTIIHPDGTETTVTLQEITPGRYELLWQAPEIGLYRLRDANAETVIALGPAAPREFEQTIATDASFTGMACAAAGRAVGDRRVAARRPALIRPIGVGRETVLRCLPNLLCWSMHEQKPRTPHQAQQFDRIA